MSERPNGTDLGARVRAGRRTHGWSQTQLAERAGVSRPTIARIEGGQDVLMGTLQDVAEALNLRLELRDPKRRKFSTPER